MKVKKFEPTEAININHRKEKHYMESLLGVVVDDGQLKEVVDLRVYGTNAMNYVCVWINDSKHNIHATGSGSAGGYGYHRPSAAASEAFAKAGVEFTDELAGRGDTIMESAVEAVVRKLYPRNKIVEVLKTHP